MNSTLNWERDQHIANEYIEACVDAASDESFSNFKQQVLELLKQYGFIKPAYPVT